MNSFSATALILLGLIVAVCSRLVCEPECKNATKIMMLNFKHVSDLKTSSVAPWNLINDTKNNREPQTIQHAHCTVCKVTNRIAKPIILEVYVNERTYSGTWCRCPYKLAVGCTCQ